MDVASIWNPLRAIVFSLLCVIALSPAAYGQTSASDHTWATRYDAAGRVAGTIAPDPDGAGVLRFAASRIEYDDRGNPVTVEKGELSDWQSETVAPLAWTDFSIQTTVETTYDALSRKLTQVVKGHDNAAVSLTQYSYDAVGRLECTALRMNPAVFGSLPASACDLGTQGAYGPDRITRTVYDAAGQVRQLLRAVGTPLQQAYTTYTYSSSGKVRQTIDANGNRAEFAYDGFDRLEKWSFPSETRPTAFDDTTVSSALASAGSINASDYEEYAYDNNGNRISLRKRDGSIITYLFDGLNRITRKTLPERSGLGTTHTRDVFYEYDLRGLQTKARFDSLTGAGITYAYDGFGRLISETQNTDGVGRAVSSQYDANGNRTRVTYPGNRVFELAFDGLNRATQLKETTTTLSAAAYNERGLMSQLAWTHQASSSNSRTMSYDPVGRLQSLALDLHGTSKDVGWSFTRNAASQVLTDTQNNDSYSWDGHANFSRDYAVNGLNQYQSAGPASFCYDANGNLTADGSSVYLYDIENRLVERRVQTNTNCSALAYSGALQAELRYDPTGRLYRVAGGTLGTQHFVYDGNALISEHGPTGGTLRRYVHGSNVDADDPLIWYEGATIGNSSRRYLHADPRGSIIAVTNYQGSSTATNSYDEYGIPDSATGNDIATKGRFRYTGQAWIPELGMYYYKARIYSPTLGRFLQTDPIGYEDQVNLYAYVANDPVNGVDPTGMELIVRGTKEYREQVKADINRIREGDGGKTLISKLINSRETVIISNVRNEGDGNSYRADSRSDASNGEGTGGTVYYNPSNTTGGLDDKGNSERPAFVGLGHELGHARAGTLGQQSQDRGTGAAGTTPPSELHSVANENMIRREHGLTERGAYHPSTQAREEEARRAREP